MKSEKLVTRGEFLKAACAGVTLVGWQGWGAEPAAVGGDGFTFVQMCDPQLGMGGYEDDVRRFTQAVAQINELKPDFVVICGDLVHNVTGKSISDFLSIRSGLKMPSYCVPGNHDIGNVPTATSLAHYRKVIGEDYYAFSHKGVRFVCTNSQLWKAPLDGETAKQDEWLAATMSGEGGKNLPTVMVGHYPLYLKTSDEKEEYSNLPIAAREKLLSLIRKNQVLAVLTGHTHRLITNEADGTLLVTGETTSKNFDKRPFGFRVWQVGTATSAASQAFVPLQQA